MNVKKILVPTDFSDYSKTAVSFGLELAINLKARLYIMHSMKSIHSITLEKLLGEITEEDRFKQVETKTITEIGDPGISILRQAQAIKADLIVMGSKGSTRVGKFLGSTTTEVTSKSNVPVLAIPKESVFSGFTNMVFMTDFNEGDLSALIEVLDWARHFNSSLHILHLFSDDSLQELIKFRGFKEVVKERLDYEKLSFERVFNPSFEEGFINYVETHSPELFILPRYKKTLFQKLTEKDHAKKIEYEATIPFLSFPAEEFVEVEQKHSILK